MAIPPGVHAEPLEQLTRTRTSTRPPHPPHPTPCPYRTASVSCCIRSLKFIIGDVHEVVIRAPLRFAEAPTKWPILVVNLHHRLVKVDSALGCTGQRILSTEGFFVEFADAGFRDGFDEDDVVEEPPFGHTRAQVVENVFFGELTGEVGFGDDEGYRSLVPLGVWDADDTGL